MSSHEEQGSHVPSPRRQGHLQRHDEDSGTCAYCGGALSPFLYFCPICATPHKPPESTLPQERPPHLSDRDRIARSAPAAMPLFWSYFTVVVLGSLLMWIVLEESRPDLQILTMESLILVVTCFYVARHWGALRVQLSRPGFDQPEAWVGLLLLGVLLVINIGYHQLVLQMLDLEATDMVERLRGEGIGGGTILVLFCVFPAVCEEIAFRGLLQHWLQVAIDPTRALLLASALFASMHFSVISFPILLLLGLLLGWVKWKTGSLYPSMLMHFLHNLVVIHWFA